MNTSPDSRDAEMLADFIQSMLDRGNNEIDLTTDSLKHIVVALRSSLSKPAHDGLREVIEKLVTPLKKIADEYPFSPFVIVSVDMRAVRDFVTALNPPSTGERKP